MTPPVPGGEDVAPTLCDDCEGRGWYVVPDCCGRGSGGSRCGEAEPSQEQCEKCNGTGIMPERRFVTCDECEGSGEPFDGVACTKCDGTGRAEESVQLITMEDLP